MNNKTKLALMAGLIGCAFTYLVTVKSRDKMWLDAAFRNGVAVHDADGGMTWKKPCTHKEGK